ncbi:hypothetical protein BpOF4_21414 (plasmid) [Alkalihalophilus pseudofirmus OF4]|uniref:Aspartyl-phosphate phosphatase Spo0E family protein n=1 Tax=Alkalihalophilus pseudofirmus (strain ATCC BAA-2126 / JCM 17055 / OF4) TaxID=398511 RepID=D3G1Q2_ALKPO|nr:aspartyl-phosphate phosphatase Spo0E family protein [Alkalihalophilus pseudofirmus]ADC52278.1 hypothetical protein BpOF4_21414 [Alkalihalophilus pseudofirmus OF4]
MKSVNKPDDLNNVINELRFKMIKLGMEKGLTHPDTIECSQSLDQFLNSQLKVKSLLS